MDEFNTSVVVVVLLEETWWTNICGLYSSLLTNEVAMLNTILCKAGSSLDLSIFNCDQHKDAITNSKLRRVFTAHVRRKSQKKNLNAFSLSILMKEPLRVIHSVPLNYSIWSLINFAVMLAEAGLVLLNIVLLLIRFQMIPI
ncbi:hypothetical protein PGB90_003763 [Kerria lacca]